MPSKQRKCEVVTCQDFCSGAVFIYSWQKTVTQHARQNRKNFTSRNWMDEA